MITPDKYGILLTKSPSGTKGEWWSELLAYMLTGPWWPPYEAQPKGHRNALVAGYKGDLHNDMMEMERAGYVAITENDGSKTLFTVTDKGLAAMKLDKIERLRAIRTARRTKGGRQVFRQPLKNYKKEDWPPKNP